MYTKQFVEKQIALEKDFKREYKETKEKEKEKEKEKDKEIFKEAHKEYALEYPQTQFSAVAPEAAQATPDISTAKTIEHKQVFEKYLVKEYKVEKVEQKEYKAEIKEYAKEAILEGKQLVDTTGYGQGLGDPYSQRLAALESAVAQLSHFIPAELRPDLSQGALKQEPDAPKPAASAPAPAKDAKK